jgi:crotonobetainyl-CoA:carnitine CoA-transferase CaiB-like acyl-CoA transferase
MPGELMARQLFAGLKVLDVGTWIAAPIAATMLADYGADVIKIEQPGIGDAYRMFASLPACPQSAINYTWLLDARNRRSLTLNLKSPEGRALLLELVAGADVYVTNQPQSMRRAFGLTYEDLRKINPGLVYASLTAYGETGPERDREGFDLVAYWSRTGLMDLVRSPDAEPSQALPGMGDHPTGVAMYASIVTALLHRERTGEGSHVHTSLMANGIWSASCLAQARLVGADFTPTRTIARQSAMRALYRTRDDRWLQFAMIRTPEEVDRWLTVLDLVHIVLEPEFATPEARLANGPALTALLRETIAQRTSAEWMAAFAGADVPAALVGTLDDLIDDPQVAANAFAPAVDAPTLGNPRVVRPPVNVDGLPRTPFAPPPTIGEHTDEILAGLGYSMERIAEWRAAGVV